MHYMHMHIGIYAHTDTRPKHHDSASTGREDSPRDSRCRVSQQTSERANERASNRASRASSLVLLLMLGALGTPHAASLVSGGLSLPAPAPAGSRSCTSSPRPRSRSARGPRGRAPAIHMAGGAREARRGEDALKRRRRFARWACEASEGQAEQEGERRAPPPKSGHVGSSQVKSSRVKSR